MQYPSRNSGIEYNIGARVDEVKAKICQIGIIQRLRGEDCAKKHHIIFGFPTSRQLNFLKSQLLKFSLAKLIFRSLK